MTAEELRAQAEQLYTQAHRIADATERAVVLRAMDLEAQADDFERNSHTGGERGSE